MSSPTSPACPSTPLCAYSSPALQHQTSSTTTNISHPPSTAPMPMSVHADASLLPQLRTSYLDEGSPAMPSTPIIPYLPLPPHTPSPNPSPPNSISTSHSSSHTLVFHPLLRYSQYGTPALVWDVRTDPTSTSLLQRNPVLTNTVTTSAHAPVPVPVHELHQHATSPPLRVLHLFCGIVPHTSTWDTITVTASPLQIGVTILDVLTAVHECMRMPITHTEWNALCEKQQNRVNETFHSRWHMSETPMETRWKGVLRQDCLLRHTLWGGLMPNFVEEDVAVLTLRRQQVV